MSTATHGPYALPVVTTYACSQCGSRERPRHTKRDVSGHVTTVWGCCCDCDNNGERRYMFGRRRNPLFNPARYPRWNVVTVEVSQ